jgi:GH24 family phage-related lysozyme (muramidase)
VSIPIAIRTKAIQLIEGYEGLGGALSGRYFKYEGKADKKGIITIGRGHVISRADKERGKISIKGIDVDFTKGLTLAQVDDLFEQDLQPRYNRLSGMFDGETEDQCAAMLCGFYNVEEMWGIKSSASKGFRAKNWKAAARGILLYTVSAGKHWLGLWRRRMSEALLFLTGRVMIAKTGAQEAALYEELRKLIPDIGSIKAKKGKLY